MRRLSVFPTPLRSVRPAAFLAIGVLVAALVGAAPVSAADASPDYSTIIGTGPVVADGIATSSITITWKDTSNAPVADVTPTFLAADEHGTNVYGPCSRTDQDGVSHCTLASRVAETKTLTITGPALWKTGSSVTFIAGPFARLLVRLPGEEWEPGTETGRSGVPNPWTEGIANWATVFATDANWNIVEGASAMVGLTSSDPAATLPQAVALNGRSLRSSITLRRSGSTITATVVGDPSTSNTSSPVTVIAGVPRLLILVPGRILADAEGCRSGFASYETAGASFAVTVLALDALCHVVPSTDVVRITSSDPKADLPGDVTLVAGRGSFNVTLRTYGNPYPTISASDVTNPAVTPSTDSIALNPPAYRLLVLLPGETFATSGTCRNGSPIAVAAGAQVTVTVRALDGGCEPMANTDVVRVATGDPSAVLPADARLAGGSGTFTVTFRTSGSWWVTATDVTDPAVIMAWSSGPLSVVTSAARLQVLLPGETATNLGTCKTESPTAATAGVAVTATVRIIDPGCGLLGSTDFVAITSSDLYAELPGNVALSGGTGTFSFTFRTAGARTITATDFTNSAVAPSTSAVVAVGAGPFARLQLLVPGESAVPGSTTGKTGPPAAQRGGAAFEVVATAVDAYWNRVSSSDVVQLTSTDPLAVLPAGAALSSGARTFAATLRTTGQTITATDLTDPGKTPSTSPAISLSAGAAYKLAFTAQPTTVGTGAPFPVSPAVIVKDVNGSTIITNASITLALAGNPTGVTLTCSGGLTRSASTGAAIFTGCSVDKAGTYTLLATSSGLLSATSVSFTVGTGVASLTLTPSATTITWSGTVNLTVRLNGAYAGRQVTLWAARDGVRFAPIAKRTTGSGGTASFTYRPATNLHYRATFAGAPNLAAATSNTARVVVRQIALLRPTNSGAVKSIARGTTLTFTTTVRPSRPGLLPASVTYWVYRNVNGVWVRYFNRNVVAASTGVASFTWTFSSSGRWYVRSMANATPYNANSVKSPTEQFKVS